MVYTFDVLSLFCRGCVRWHPMLMCLRTRQVAVCGRGGSYVIDRQFARDLEG